MPVTPTPSAVRQDASIWRDRISSALQDLNRRNTHAQQLQIAMKRDETTHETHDNFTSLCLGKLKYLLFGTWSFLQTWKC